MPKRFYSFIILLIALTLVVAACGGSDDAATESTVTATYQTITVAQAHQSLQDNPDAVFVDVRTREEYVGGHAEGAILIPLDDLANRAPRELPKDAEIYVICRSGNRSQLASETLIGLGYTHIYNIQGGTQAWADQNLPMSTAN